MSVFRLRDAFPGGFKMLPFWERIDCMGFKQGLRYETLYRLTVTHEAELDWQALRSVSRLLLKGVA